MKLIDILVQELPKRGGWPIDSDDERTLTATLPGICWGLDSGGYYAFRGPCDSVSHKLYEETLLALKSGWDGEGLPPVGCECEIKRVADWMPVTIKFISDYHTVFTTFGGTEDCYQTSSLQFRPIRSEADKKRDEVIEALKEGLGHAHGLFDLMQIYHLLKDGKIPHIRID